MRLIGTRQVFRLLSCVLLLLSSPALAQKQPSDEDLVKQTQNPVADLISVPLQNNFNFGTGGEEPDGLCRQHPASDSSSP